MPIKGNQQKKLFNLIMTLYLKIRDISELDIKELTSDTFYMSFVESHSPNRAETTQVSGKKLNFKGQLLHFNVSNPREHYMIGSLVNVDKKQILKVAQFILPFSVFPENRKTAVQFIIPRAMYNAKIQVFMEINYVTNGEPPFIQASVPIDQQKFVKGLTNGIKYQEQTHNQKKRLVKGDPNKKQYLRDYETMIFSDDDDDDIFFDRKRRKDESSESEVDMNFSMDDNEEDESHHHEEEEVITKPTKGKSSKGKKSKSSNKSSRRNSYSPGFQTQAPQQAGPSFVAMQQYPQQFQTSLGIQQNQQFATQLPPQTQIPQIQPVEKPPTERIQQYNQFLQIVQQYQAQYGMQIATQYYQQYAPYYQDCIAYSKYLEDVKKQKAAEQQFASQIPAAQPIPNPLNMQQQFATQVQTPPAPNPLATAPNPLASVPSPLHRPFATSNSNSDMASHSLLTNTNLTNSNPNFANTNPLMSQTPIQNQFQQQPQFATQIPSMSPGSLQPQSPAMFTTQTQLTAPNPLATQQFASQVPNPALSGVQQFGSRASFGSIQSPPFANTPQFATQRPQNY